MDQPTHPNPGSLEGTWKSLLTRLFAVYDVPAARGPIMWGWWIAFIRPTARTFAAWSPRVRGWRIPASFIVAMLLSGLSGAVETMYSRDVTLGHTTSQQYLIQPTLLRVLSHAGALALASPLISLAVITAIALAVRGGRTREAESVWRRLLRSWSLAQPACGGITLVSSAGLLALAALLQSHLLPTTGAASVLVGVWLYLLTLLWPFAVLAYVVTVLTAVVTAVVPTPSRSVAWVAFGAYLLSGIVVGVAFDLIAAALGIPRPLFG